MKHFESDFTARAGLRLLLIIFLVMGINSCNRTNPFFSEWDTPYGIPPFEEIQEKDYIEAIEAGIHRQSVEIDAILAKDDKPTFENTVEAYELSGALLDKVTGVLFNLAESDATEQMQAIVSEALPMLSEHNDNIFMNPYFFGRVKELYDNRASLDLTAEQNAVLEKLYRTFVNNGIALDAAGQRRMREINKEMSALQQQFGNNLLAETNSFRLVLTDSSQLAGLPDAVVSAAAADAAAAGISVRDAMKMTGADSVAEGGPWLFTLHNPSYVPFMTYSSRRDLREKMFMAYSSRGNNGNATDNNAVVVELMKLRIEKARLLGYETPADYILSDKMAHDAATVDRFLDGIFVPAVAKAEEEKAAMQSLMDEDVKAGLLPEDSTPVICPWDWAYYAERIRHRDYELNESLIKPYFKMENVREGVFEAAHRLYGLNFETLDSIPSYHPDMEGFKVTDSDGSFVGILLTDYYPRPSKRGGAWMSNFRNQYVDEDGHDVRPIIVNVGNFTKPSAGKPSLLTLDEAATMFHEFGHALHGLLSKCTYKDVSGTSVARDFVELPSQLNENWTLQPETLEIYARHYETGEVIPDSLVVKIRNAGTFNQGFMTTELTAASILDMRWHELTSVYVPADCPFASESPAPEGAEAAVLMTGGKSVALGSSPELRVIDPSAFESYVMECAGLIDEIIPRYRTTYFNHIFNGGYNAGYYSYLWAEVLDKDAFEFFKSKGIFNRDVSMSYRRNILEKGGSEDPMVLYRRFRGSEPDPAALLRARGLD